MYDNWCIIFVSCPIKRFPCSIDDVIRDPVYQICPNTKYWIIANENLCKMVKTKRFLLRSDKDIDSLSRRIWYLLLSYSPIRSFQFPMHKCLRHVRRVWTIAVPFEPPNGKTNKMTCAPSEDSDQLIRVFAEIWVFAWAQNVHICLAVVQLCVTLRFTLRIKITHLVSKLNTESLLKQGLSESEFYGELGYNLDTLLVGIIFLINLGK